MNILQIPSANRFVGRNGYTPRYIILHGTAGFQTAQDVGYYFQSADVSSNYIIGKDGTIVCSVNEEDGAWGNGILDPGHDAFWSETLNPNLITISIEHVKNQKNAAGQYDNSDQLTDAQKAASFALVAQLCQKWGIPLRQADASGGITGHFSIAPINRRDCPGPYPWNELFIQTGETMNTSDPFFTNHFIDDGSGVYQCKNNGLRILGAIAQYWLFCNAAPRLPLSGELSGLFPEPDVVAQVFEAGIIVYDPGLKHDRPDSRHSCYLLKASDPLFKSLLQKYGAMPTDPQSNPPVGDAITTLQDLQKTVTQVQTDLDVVLVANQHALKLLQGNA